MHSPVLSQGLELEAAPYDPCPFTEHPFLGPLCPRPQVISIQIPALPSSHHGGPEQAAYLHELSLSRNKEGTYGGGAGRVKI